MKVILSEDVKGQGKKGELVTVSDRYARNYLLPRGLAVMANSENMNILKSKEAAKADQLRRELEAAKALAAKIGGLTVKVTAKGGQSGKLFGSVTSKEISEALKAQHKMDLDKKKIVLEDDIKSFGTFEVEAKIYKDVSAKFYVLVTEA